MVQFTLTMYSDDETMIELAGCLLVDDYGRILLLHRYVEPSQWELPGGKVETDETPEMAAIREINEELGLNVVLTHALGKEAFEQDDQQYLYHWFQASIVGGQPQVVETETFDDFDYFEIEDLPSLALSANMLILQNKLLTGEVTINS